MNFQLSRSRPPATGRWRLLRQTTLLVVFVIVALSVYFLNMTPAQTTDDVPNSILPFQLLLHHNFFLEDDLPRRALHEYYVRPFHNHSISSYPFGAALTAIPVYALYLLSGVHASVHTAVALGKISATVIATTSAIVIYHVLAALDVRPAYRLVFTLLYAFGTETFAISSQGLWQHGPAELWVSVFLLVAAKLYRNGRVPVWHSLAAGFAAGMLLLTRPQDMVILLPFATLLFFRSRWPAVLPAIPVVLVFAGIYELYNLHFYAEPTHYGSIDSAVGRLSAPFLSGLQGNTVSPSRGLLVFSPWAVFALFWFAKWRDSAFWRGIYAPSLAALLLYVTMYAKLGYWAAGTSYGPRYMTDISPVFVILAAGFFNQLRRHNTTVGEAGPRRSKAWWPAALQGALALLGVWSISVQALGAYVPAGEEWNNAVIPDTFMRGMWSVPDGEIAYYVHTLAAERSPRHPLTDDSVAFHSVQLFAKAGAYAPPQPVSSYTAATVYHGRAVMKNTGTQVWNAYPSHHGVGMAQLQITVWHNGRELPTAPGMRPFFGDLLHSVPPGQSIMVDFNLSTPSKPGNYTVRFTLAQASEMGSPPPANAPSAYLHITVVAPPLAQG